MTGPVLGIRGGGGTPRPVEYMVVVGVRDNDSPTEVVLPNALPSVGRLGCCMAVTVERVFLLAIYRRLRVS